MDRDTLQNRIWSMSSRQLAEQCKVLAEAKSGSVEDPLRAEARRLYDAWSDALNQPEDTYEDHSRKASLQAGLRKRTIEILIKVSQRMGS